MVGGFDWACVWLQGLLGWDVPSGLGLVLIGSGGMVVGWVFWVFGLGLRLLWLRVVGGFGFGRLLA